MKIRNAVIAAGVSALLASGGFAWAAYTGQLNIIQWAGTVLGVPTTWGTAPTGTAVIGANVDLVTCPACNNNGSAVSSGSSPVVIASDQVAVAVKAASGAFASGAIADGAEVTLGAKADAKAATTDATPITAMQVLKEISAMAQAPAALPANQSTNIAQIGGTSTSSSPLMVAASTAPVTATNAALTVALRPDSPGIIAAGTAGSASANVLTVQGIASMTPLGVGGVPATPATAAPVAFSTQYPVNATTTAPIPETISATATTGAFTATLATAVGKTTFICGFQVDATATSATTTTLTLTGTITGTMNFQESVSVVGSNLGHNPHEFNPCIPASSTNTTIVVNAGAAGTGGVAVISAWGYQL